MSKSAKPWLRLPNTIPSVSELKRGLDLSDFKKLGDPAELKKILRSTTCKVFQAAKKLKNTENSCILLQGGTHDSNMFYENDVELIYFRQEPFFRYIFGINEPDCLGFLDLNTQEKIGVVPKYDFDSWRWNGKQLTLQEYCDKYGWDLCIYTSDLVNELRTRGIEQLFLLEGQNTDSGNLTVTTANFDGIDQFTVDTAQLFHILVQCRLKKTPEEVDFIRTAMTVSSQAHVCMMKYSTPGLFESHMEAYFRSFCSIYGNTRYLAYGVIACSGETGSILHYGHSGRPNDQPMSDGDMFLCDAGAEYAGYATDITSCWPVNGKFTEDQKLIYNIVLRAQNSVKARMKNGVDWTDMHRLAERIILEGLKEIGLLRGEVADMINDNLATLFMPHGLGHLIGMNVHDVGGFTESRPRSKEPGLCWLRTTRILETGMMITVEPGLYFNNPWIEKKLELEPHLCRYIVEEVMARFRTFGGVRIEDNILILDDGIDCLTNVPRTVEDIEEVMRKPACPVNMKSALGFSLLVAGAAWLYKKMQ